MSVLHDPGGAGSAMRDYLSDYLGAVERGHRAAALDVGIRMLEAGYPAEQVITGLLARAQQEAGRAWQEGRWSIAMEHRASAITDVAVTAVAEAAVRAPGAPDEGSRGRAVVACAEGEWHGLPARMMSEVLRLRGVEVWMIGPSIPADQIGPFLGEDGPRLVAVTCSMPHSLVGAWRTITALRGIGATVVCGGRGFGSGGEWARDLGADAWSPDFSSGADRVLALVDEPAPAPRPSVVPELLAAQVAATRRAHAGIVERAMGEAVAAWPVLMARDAALRATREDLDATLRTVTAAALVEDHALVTDYVAWFESVLRARDLPVAFVPSAFDLLLHHVPAALDRVRPAVLAGREACTADPLPRG